MTPIFVRLSDVGPVASGAWRLALAGVVFWGVYAALQRRSGEPVLPLGAPPRALALMVVAGMGLAFNLALWQASVMFTSIANAALLSNVHPIFAALAAWIALSERITGRFVAGTALALAGTYALVGWGTTDLATMRVGDILALGSGAFLGVWIVLMTHLRGHFTTLQVITFNHTLACPIMFIMALTLGEPILPASANGWLVIIMFALLVNIAGQTAFMFAMGRLKASFTALAMLTAPVFAAALGWLVFGEAMGAVQIGAGAAVLAGIALAQQGGQRNQGA